MTWEQSLSSHTVCKLHQHMADSSQAATSQVFLASLVSALLIFPSAKASIEDGKNIESRRRQGSQNQDAEFSHMLMIDATKTDFVILRSTSNQVHIRDKSTTHHFSWHQCASSPRLQLDT